MRDETTGSVRTGTVVRWVADRGFGFVAPDDGGPDVFLHATAIGPSARFEGARVSFSCKQTPRGAQARH